MKNNKTLLLALILILGVALGCSKLNPFSGSRSGETNSGNSHDKTLTDKAVDTTVGESKIGVPECDEVMDELTKEMNNPDDNFITKAAKATVLNRIKDGIRESVEKNKQDKVELAKTCREFKQQLDKYKQEEESKPKGN